MRVGIVSDIHGSYNLLVDAYQSMGPIDCLIHAGDGRAEIDRLLDVYPIRCERVAGNCDMAPHLPTETRFELEGYRIYLTHGHLYGVKNGLFRIACKGQEEAAQLVIFGHTHEPYRGEYHGVTLLNPGSLSAARCLGRPSYGLMILDRGGIQTEIRYL